MIEGLTGVVLTTDLPERSLRAGHIGTVVLVHQQGTGDTVEFRMLGGETVVVVTAPAGGVRPGDDAAERRSVAAAREMERAGARPGAGAADTPGSDRQ